MLKQILVQCRQFCASLLAVIPRSSILRASRMAIVANSLALLLKLATSYVDLKKSLIILAQKCATSSEMISVIILSLSIMVTLLSLISLIRLHLILKNLLRR